MNEPLFLALGLGTIVVIGLGRLTRSQVLRHLTGAMAFLALAALTRWGVRLVKTEGRLTELADVALLLALAFLVARSALVLLFDIVLHRHVGLRIPRLARDVLSFLVYALATAGILHSFLGLELGTLLATSAVVTVVVGLALQETLGTLLAGLALTSERRLSAGTWVEVDGTVGEVEELGWRSLVLRTITGEHVLVPNSQATRARIKVLGDGHDPVAVRLQVGVGYDAPPPAVVLVLLRAATDTPGVLAKPAPEVGLWSFGDNAIVYECRLFTLHPWRDMTLRHEFLSRVVAALQRAGFAIPFPQRTVHLAKTAPLPAHPDTPAHLAACPLFTGLPEDALGDLGAASHHLQFFPGESVVRHGEVSRALFVVTAGTAAVEVDGQEVASLVPGDVFGEMAFLSGEPRTATVRAAAMLDVVEVDAHAMQALLGRHPELADELANRMAARQQELLAHAESVRTGPQSVTSFLRDRLLKLLG
jgi:small-conductance mechanosensitive channel/CRP-like cAMP-binding protein